MHNEWIEGEHLLIYNIYIYTRREDRANASSLLDHFGHFDVPIFDAKAPDFWFSNVWCWSPDRRYTISDAEAPTLETRSSMLKQLNPESLMNILENLAKIEET